MLQGTMGSRLFALAFALLFAATFALGFLPNARGTGGGPPEALDAPFSTNVRVNSGGTGYAHQVEPTMVLDSAGRIFAGWKEAITATGGGQRVAFSYSADGGLTWAPNFVMPLVTLAHQSDPWLTVTPTDRVFFTRIEYADTSSSGGIAVTNTTDGVTWGTTWYYDDGPNFADKESAAHDAAGNLYWVWNSDGAQQDMAFARSDDGGQTWTPKQYIEDLPNVIGGIVQVAPNGNVIATWWSYVTSDIIFDRSVNGGISWGTDVRVNDLPGSAGSPLPADPVVLPAMAVAADGTIHVVWPDYRNGRPGGIANGNMDIMASHSLDGGATWSPAVRVNDDATTARQWMPDLAIDPSGVVHVAWMDDRTGQHNVYYANSTNGGVSFGPNVRVSTVGTPFSFTRPGDYLAIESAPNGTVDVVWTDGRGADQDIYFASLPPSTDYLLDTVPTGLTLTLDGSPITAPYRFPCANGTLHFINAPSPQSAGATRYTFNSWSDGGPQSHPISCSSTHAYTAFFTTEHQVTVATSPAGLNLVVDGNPIITPQTYWWVGGTSHTLSAISPQVQGTTRYTYASWSDGGAQSHGVVASAPATFTAAFGTEFQVGVDTSPPNLNVIVDGAAVTAPQTYWWAQGSPHTLDVASPQTVGSVQYSFTDWSDTGAQSHPVVATAPQTYTANFGLAYEITLATQPTGLQVSVDGAVFAAPYTFWCDGGSSPTIDAPTPTLTPGSKATFVSWSGGGAQSHMVTCTAPATYVATFLIEENVTLDTIPSGLQLALDTGTVSTPYSFWCAQGATHGLDAPSPQGTAGTRRIFASWSDNGAPSHTFRCFAPGTFTATFSAEFEVTIATSPTGLDVVVDGIDGPAPRTYWWAEGSSHPLDVVSPQGPGSTRFAFSSWSDGGGRAHARDATEPATVTATFRTQYQLEVTSPYGVATCDVPLCWYDAEGTATFSLTPTTVDGASGTRSVFDRWTGDSSAIAASATISMDGPRSVIAQWHTEYTLTIVSEYGSPQGAGWHAEGSVASVSIEGTVTVNGTTYRFTGWTGDATASTATTSVTMDGPKQLTARWEVVPPTPAGTLPSYFSWLLAILLAVILFLALLLWRRRRKKDEGPPEAAPPAK